MFGKFTVNSHDWCVLDEYFQTICPQIIEHYLGSSQEKPWLLNRQQSLNVYSAVHNLCIAKESRNERTYAFYEKMLQEFIHFCQIKISENQNQLSITQREVKQWQGYCEFFKICKRVFAYLDRYYLDDNQLESLEIKALSTYETVHLSPNNVLGIIENLMLEFAEKRGRRELGDDSILKISKMFQRISSSTKSTSYEMIKKLVEAVACKYYQKLNERYIQMPPQKHLQELYDILEFEEKVHELALPFPDSKLYEVAFKIQIIDKAIPILIKHDQGLKLFFHEERIEDLKRIYGLFKRFDQIRELQKFYCSYVRNWGFSFFEGFRGQNLQIEQILTKFQVFHQQVLELTTQVFESSSQFLILFRKIMEVIVHLHDQEFALAQGLAEAVSRHFTTENKTKDIQPIVVMFDCLTSKDIFIETYESNLTARLLGNECNLSEEEIKFIDGIKQKCGENFTEPIEMRIKDYLLALELGKQFIDNKTIEDSLAFSIKVLSRKSWVAESKPLQEYSSFDIVWPQQLIHVKSQFEAFYCQRNENKHIKYLPLLSTTLLSIKYLGIDNKIAKHDIRTNLLQASLLMFIEQSKTQVSEKELFTQFSITPELFSTQISTFILGTNPLVLLGDNGYQFNNHFNPLENGLNMQIPNLRKNSKAETSNVDRDLAIQGAIIKTLKSKGHLQFDQLVQLVIFQLKFFKPSIPKIKEGIEKLIERDYIERLPDQPNTFIYKA